MPGDTPTTTNFVQDYAAKRAAQLERAKKIREERQSQQQQKLSSSPTNISTSLSPPILPPPVQARRIANVVEEDFKRATKAGIITPDQARQLWAMLSDQLVHVEDTQASNMMNSSSKIPTISSTHGLSGLANSISMDSLRASIAQFKEQQRRQQQLDGGVSTGDGKTRVSGMKNKGGGSSKGVAKNQSVTEAYDIATRVFAPSSGGIASGTVGLSASRTLLQEPSAGSIDDGIQQAEKDADDWGLRKSQALLQGRRRERQQKPAWNSDVEVVENDGSDSRVAGPAALHQRKQPPKRPPSRSRESATLQLDDMPVGGGAFAPGAALQPQLGIKPINSSGKKKPVGTVPRTPTNRVVPLSIDDVVVGGGETTKINAVPTSGLDEPLAPCGLCGRTFRKSILARHEKACRNVQKKRRAFDVKGQRLEGIEGIEEVAATSAPQRNSKKQSTGGISNANPNKLPKWKIQHEQFQAAMRAMRQLNDNEGNSGNFVVAGGKKPGNQPQQQQQQQQPARLPDMYDDRVLCQHCGRKFSEVAAERHIPKCATTIAKPKGLRPTR